MGLSGHQSARMKNDEWLTPPEIVSALGPFDLDPCSPVERPWPTAAQHFTVRDEGDHRADDIVKREWLDGMLVDDRQRLVAAFDDRDRVVAMWRAAGVQCFQVAPGDF